MYINKYFKLQFIIIKMLTMGLLFVYFLLGHLNTVQSFDINWTEFAQTIISNFSFLSHFITFVCSQLMGTNTTLAFPNELPDIKNLAFMFHTNNGTQLIPLLEVEKLLENRNFDVNKTFVLFVTGWMQHPKNSTHIDNMAKAYHTRGDFNFLSLDDGNYLNTFMYTWAAVSTETIGRHIASSLTKLYLRNIHLIGHSLGAHVIGAAGRYFKLLNQRSINRLTGLDPARPCFSMQNALQGLFRNDADFVDIIHTNPGYLGIQEVIGDADFYVDGLSPLVPGCIDIICAHMRSILYYTESIYIVNERNFLAIEYSTFKNKTKNFVTMGFAIPITTKGIFWLTVNSNSPYGKGK